MPRVVIPHAFPPYVSEASDESLSFFALPPQASDWSEASVWHPVVIPNAAKRSEESLILFPCA